MSEEKNQGKYLCADFLAVFGAILLLMLEYMKAVGFMEMPVTKDSTMMVAGRWYCLSGAMLLSGCVGYVMSKKHLSWHHVTSLLRLFYIYVVSSLIALLGKRLILDEYLTKEELLDMMRSFTATDTAKFAGMYVMLLLFAPFLSAAFRELKTYNARLAFLAVTAGVSTLQPMLVLSGKYLIPEWCKMLAPFAGFIGGAFVRKYAKSLSRGAYLVLLLLLCGLQTAAVMYICTQRGILYYPQFDSMAALPALMTALLTLSFFHSDKKKDTAVNRFFSNASGGMIAALILGDTLIDFCIPSLAEYFPDQKSLLSAGLVAVPIIFILCCAGGIFLQIPVFLLRALFGEEAYEYVEEEAEEKPVQKKQDKIKPIRKLEPIEETPFPDTMHLPKPNAFETETAHIPIVAEEPPTMHISEPIPEPEPEPIPEPEPEPIPVPEKKPECTRSYYDSKESIDELIAKITGGSK